MPGRDRELEYAGTIPAVEDGTASAEGGAHRHQSKPRRSSRRRRNPLSRPKAPPGIGQSGRLAVSGLACAGGADVPLAPEPVQAAARQPEPTGGGASGRGPAGARWANARPRGAGHLGLAAHRAGLDAMETLDAPPPAARAAASDGTNGRGLVRIAPARPGGGGARPSPSGAGNRKESARPRTSGGCSIPPSAVPRRCSTTSGRSRTTTTAVRRATPLHLLSV